MQPLVADSESRFHVQEPDYTSVIPPMQLRRMSRILKMGVYCGMKCLQEAGLAKPDGIITGTGKGSMTDTEKFVKELKQFNEEAMNPTPFILSTYNAINGAIALQTGATGYNQTFVHRGSSFEASLYDAQLKLHASDTAQTYLAGCFDEITPEYFLVKDKIGYWKKDRDPQKPLWEQAGSEGTIAGEGAAFFTLSNRPDAALMALHAVRCAHRLTPGEVAGAARDMLLQEAWAAPDMLVLGINGDATDEPFYREILQRFNAVPVLAFKHLCGEYETSGGFAFWLMTRMMAGEQLTDAVWYRAPAVPDFRPQKILYYNHYRGLNHNLALLSADGRMS